MSSTAEAELLLENPVAPGWFWAVWGASLLSALPIMLCAFFVIWFGLDTASYVAGLSGFAVLAICIFAYWYIHQRIDGYWQKTGIYRQAVYAMLSLPAAIYLLLGYLYRDF
jgi:hypothetical protein